MVWCSGVVVVVVWEMAVDSRGVLGCSCHHLPSCPPDPAGEGGLCSASESAPSHL